MITTIAVSSHVATFINIFTVEATKQQALLDHLKTDTETINKQPGFITANFHRSLDGIRVINYVQWTSIEASKAIHQNPDISASFASYQDLGVSLDLRYYEVALTRGQPIKVEAHNNLITQIDLFHVTPEDQQSLLQKLTQVIDPVIAKQTGNLSTAWIRSLDGNRIINYSQWSNKDAYDAAMSNLNWAADSEEQAAIKNLVQQLDSHLYQIDFIADTNGLLT
ncbi:antibiotic biosynthesis monooxygenase [Nostoc sp. XA010]|uniref:antibiotic biosynthesis monooxygenase n=1 Tax=Nostoc sp. XA010 TaxID=2780407 RepID=UPI001E4AE4E8|nr:antibiotic biosynthesis monooxygenase [Nostoc sp. XA010]MCC5661233.1 antibiotic biosynthesis monooxygenase [Nostoc sp. XA010]